MVLSEEKDVIFISSLDYSQTGSEANVWDFRIHFHIAEPSALRETLAPTVSRP